MSTATIVVEQAGSEIVLRRTVDVRPAQPRRATVMVHESAHAALWGMDPDLLDGLDRQLRLAGPRVAGMLLLASAAGRSRAGDAAPVAARLAKRLDVEVVAPEGDLVVLAGGEAFSAGPGTGWCSFKRGRRARRSGPRFPAPVWQAALPKDVAPAVATPAGLWVRAGGPAALSDPAFLAPPGGRPTVVVGAPGEAPPELGMVARIVSSLRSAWVLAPYGPDPAGAVPVAQRLAERLGRPVHALHGMPWYSSDGTPRLTVVDRHGRPTWPPFRCESVYHPGGSEPTPAFWAPIPGLAAAGAGCYRLTDGWLVETIPSGLLVRPARDTSEPTAMRLAIDPDHVNLVIAGAGRGAGEPPPALLDAVGRLADALPAAARSRLRLVASPGLDPAHLSGLATALRVGVCALTSSGPEPLATPSPVPSPGPQRRHAGHPDPGPPDLASLGRQVQQVPGGRACGPAEPPGSIQAGTAAPAPPTPAAPTIGAASTIGRVTVAASGVPAVATGPGAPPRVAPTGDGPALAEPIVVDADGRLRPVGSAWRQVTPNMSAAAGSGAAVPTVALPTVALPTVALPTVAESGPTAAVPVAEPSVDAAASTVPPAVAEAAPDRASPGGAEPGRAEPPTVWQASGPSTPEARRALRQTLGRRYDAATGAVTRLLAERPGLRGAGSSQELLAELVAVRTFATVPPAELAPLLDPAFVACLVAGVRRLPSLQGIAVRGMPAAEVSAGAELAEPTPTIAVADPAARVDGALRAVIWSATGRRLDGLVPAGRADEVIFLPGTVFRVLAVADGVLFATEGTRREQDARILDRLRRAS